MLKVVHILTLAKKLMIKILNFKLLIMLEYQNSKTFFLNSILQIGLKTFLQLKKLKNKVPWRYVIIDLNGEEIEQELQ